ncbi:hypothetical protein XELAEV_18038469mg [Xenopus laevis]|uniref:Uncharacterized protein n=1 Tax=Xenopus laevis TaxID=8355 RepID=A0A974H705_XENLA|nr:hypothetical protein XELAEV_18038469mg [Xenopus laevis]
MGLYSCSPRHRPYTVGFLLLFINVYTPKQKEQESCKTSTVHRCTVYIQICQMLVDYFWHFIRIGQLSSHQRYSENVKGHLLN